MSEVILYSHRGSPKEIDKLRDWWISLNCDSTLIIRLDEDDPDLPEISDYLSETRIPYNWNIAIGPRIEGKEELCHELSSYSDWRIQKDLCLVATDTGEIGLRLIGYALRKVDHGEERQ